MRIYNAEGDLISDVRDALYELGNVGTGMASVTISRLLKTRIIISTPRVICADRDFNGIFDEDLQGEVVGIIMNMKKTLSGVVLFVVGEGFMRDMVKTLTGDSGDLGEIIGDEGVFSAIQEFGNVAGAAYVKAISSYTKIRIYLSPVLVGTGDVVSLISYQRTTKPGEKVICVDSEFSIGDDSNNLKKAGRVIMMPDADSVETIMASLGM